MTTNQPMTPVSRRAHLGIRPSLSYVDVGSAQSTDVLVMLPGLSDSWRSWERVLPHLPSSMRVIAVSQRGHGDSDKPEAGYSVRDYARDLEALLEALAIPRAVVVGHSSASLVARRFALDRPERTAGLVLEGSFVTLAGSAAEGAGERFLTLQDPIDREFVRSFAAGTVGREVDAGFVEAMVEEGLRLPARVWRETFRSLLSYDDSSELGATSVPTLLVWGDRDTIVDRTMTDALMRTLQASKLIVYEGVGHTPHWEVPEKFASDVAGFVIECVPDR